MRSEWPGTPERRCSQCLCWVPASSIKPHTARCRRCVSEKDRARQKARGPRLRGDTSHLPVTARQMEVLRARFRTGSRKDAATALGISEHTMRWHIKSLLERVGVTNIDEAAYALWLRDLWGER